MEVHQLRYFLAVADFGSFTRAAEKCLVAQPSLSQQIIKLERELRRPLFERLGRTIRLTEAGRVLYTQAASILRTMDEVTERLTAATESGKGTITIGAIPTIAPYLLPPIVKTFGKRFPDATVAIHENLTEITLRACLEGAIDVGVIATPVNNENLESEALFAEPLLLALPPGHVLEKRRRVSLDEVADQPFVLMDEVHCLGEQVIGFCKRAGCLPVVRCKSVQILTIQRLVALGHGVSLIPAMACGVEAKGGCAYRKLADPAPTRTIRMVWRKERYQSPVVKEFLATLRKVTTFPRRGGVR